MHGETVKFITVSVAIAFIVISIFVKNVHFYYYNFIVATRAATITPVTTATTINTMANSIFFTFFICV
jgi:branched-subunit amino acid transport protein